MRKYLFTMLTLVLMGMALTGCNHDMDLYNAGTPEKSKEAKEHQLELLKSEYSAVFEVSFGRVGKDVDWGFSDEAGTRSGAQGCYRIIAEDFEAKSETDFDFNDVVFDILGVEGDKTRLRLLAAGGIYKLTVGGIEVHEALGAEQGENGLYPMISTGGDSGYAPVEILIDGRYETPEQIKGIDIKVHRQGFEEEGIPLEAEKGKPACKILVDSDFTIIGEQKNIASEQENFTTYVHGDFEGHHWWK